MHNDTINVDIINKVSEVCIKIFADKKNYKLPEEYSYSHLPLCVIDAVFSIGVRYKSVQNTRDRFCEFYKIEKFNSKVELTTSDFLNLIQKISPQELTENIFDNRQRTSTKNGILKSEAIIKFLNLLQKFKIERFIDVNSIVGNEKFEIELKKIPGQKSGICLKYFLMLSGSDDLIKPDRMIRRFLEEIIAKKINLIDCQSILQEVVKQMNTKGFKLTSKKLDNLIWNYQRAL